MRLVLERRDTTKRSELLLASPTAASMRNVSEVGPISDDATDAMSVEEEFGGGREMWCCGTRAFASELLMNERG
jgi:hypothetical protein